MDSDDEFDDARLGIGIDEMDSFKWTFRDSSRLPLRLYEDKIYDSVKSFGRSTDPPPTAEEYEKRRNMLWVWHQARFFETLMGYHKGECDLTGRHRTRYERLLSRLSKLMEELHPLLARATLVSEDEVLLNGLHTITWREYEFQSSDMGEWSAFAKRWHVPFESAYSLKSRIDTWLACLSDNPLPRLQQLKLLDMPTEILENIVPRCNGKDLRSLSATCHALRDIALTDVYTTCSFAFTTDNGKTDWEQARERDENGVSPYLRELVLQQQARILRRIDALRRQPYALDRTKRIHYVDDWTTDGTRGYEGFLPLIGHSADRLLSPLLSRLCFLVFRCPLESLFFSSREFTGIIWDAVRSSTTLRTLTIDARVQDYPMDWLSAPSIVNLNLHLQNRLGLRMWEIISLCPNLRYLHFWSFENQASRIPARIATSPDNMFRVLTRIVLSGIHANSITVVIRALHAAADAITPRTLPLTHLGIKVASSLIKRETVLSLVEALSRTSLRALYLHNVHYARSDLLRVIANRLPMLEALTLIHQQRHRYNRDHRVDWPDPAYEYALALRDFQRLSVFCFNNALSTLGEISPLHITQCEEDYMHAEANNEAAWKEWFAYPVEAPWKCRAQDIAFHPNDRDYLGSQSWVLPRLFAIHCPTLRLLHETYKTWAFDRHVDGRIRVRSSLSSDSSGLTSEEYREAGDMYDLGYSARSWQI